MTMGYLGVQLIKSNKKVSLLYGFVLFVVITSIVLIPSVFRAKTQTDYERRVNQYGRYDCILINASDYAIKRIQKDPLSLNINRYGVIESAGNSLVNNSYIGIFGSFDDISFSLSGIKPLMGRICEQNKHEVVLTESVYNTLLDVEIGNVITVQIGDEDYEFLLTGIIPDYTLNWSDTLVNDEFIGHIRQFPVIITGDVLADVEESQKDIIIELVRLREDDHSILYTNDLILPSGEKSYECLLNNERNPRWWLSRMNDRYSLGIVISSVLVLVIVTRYLFIILKRKLHTLTLIGAESSQEKAIYVSFFLLILFLASIVSAFILLILGRILQPLLTISIFNIKNTMIYLIFCVLYLYLVLKMAGQKDKNEIIAKPGRNSTIYVYSLLARVKSVHFKHIAILILRRLFSDLALILVIIVLCALMISNNLVSDSLSKKSMILNNKVSILNNPSFQDSIMINDFQYGMEQGLTREEVEYISHLEGINDVTLYFSGFYETILTKNEKSLYADLLYEQSQSEIEYIEDKYTVDSTLLPKAHGMICIKTVDDTDFDYLEQSVKEKVNVRDLEDGVIIICKDVRDETGAYYKNDYYFEGDRLEIAAINYIGRINSKDDIDPEAISLQNDSFYIKRVINLSDSDCDSIYKYPITVLMTKALFWNCNLSKKSNMSFELQKDITANKVSKLVDQLKRFVAQDNEIILQMPDFTQSDLETVQLYERTDSIFNATVFICIVVSAFSIDYMSMMESKQRVIILQQTGIRNYSLVIDYIVQRVALFITLLCLYRLGIRSVLIGLEQLFKISSIVDLRVESIVNDAIYNYQMVLLMGSFIYSGIVVLIKTRAVCKSFFTNSSTSLGGQS